MPEPALFAMLLPPVIAALAWFTGTPERLLSLALVPLPAMVFPPMTAPEPFVTAIPFEPFAPMLLAAYALFEDPDAGTAAVRDPDSGPTVLGHVAVDHRGHRGLDHDPIHRVPGDDASVHQSGGTLARLTARSPVARAETRAASGSAPLPRNRRIIVSSFGLPSWDSPDPSETL